MKETKTGELKCNQDGQTVIPGAPTDSEIKKSQEKILLEKKEAYEQEQFLQASIHMNEMLANISQIIERSTVMRKDDYKKALTLAMSLEAICEALEHIWSNSNGFGRIDFKSGDFKHWNHILVKSESVINFTSDDNSNTKKLVSSKEEFINIKLPK
jgi:hypothetical protein